VSSAQPASITVDDFARITGLPRPDVPADLARRIASADLRYQPLSPEEREQVVADIQKKLARHEFAVAGKARQGVWEKAWAERMQAYTQQAYAAESLVPAYHQRPDEIVRLDGEYVRACQPNLELRFSNLFRSWLFQQYLGPVDAVYEFGCGSGLNLLMLSEIYPDKHLIGLDWAAPSVELVNLIAKTRHLNLKGQRFDFFAPDDRLEFPPTSAVLTMCALEQIGDQFELFLQHLLKKSPALCVNMEPLCELYEAGNLADDLALEYHTQRGYLGRYLSRLRELAAAGQIELIKIQRVRFGSLYHDGYSYVVWRPRKA